MTMELAIELPHQPGLAARRYAMIGIALSMGMPFIVLLASMATVRHLGIALLPISFEMIVMVAMIATVLFWAIKVERLTLAQMGINRPTWGSLGFAMLGIVASVLVMIAWYALILPLFGGGGAKPERFDLVSNTPMIYFALWSLRSGVAEELLFRAFPITRLEWLTGKPWIALLVPWAAFVALHIPRMSEVLAPTALVGAVLTGLYWWRRDFWCNALCHFLIDFASFGMTALAAHHATSGAG